MKRDLYFSKPLMNAAGSLGFAPDTRVLVFTVIVSLATAVLFGLVPALQSVRRDLVTALRDDADRSGYRRSRLRSGLVIAQVVLCTVLVAGCRLFLRSLGNAKAIARTCWPSA